MNRALQLCLPPKHPRKGDIFGTFGTIYKASSPPPPFNFLSPSPMTSVLSIAVINIQCSNPLQLWNPEQLVLCIVNAYILGL